MLIRKLRNYLDEQEVKYIHINHPPAYTAQEIAHLVHVHGKEMAKTVIVNVDGDPAMAVLPGSRAVNFQYLSTELHNANVYLESEDEFRDLFPDCELGAMPPFGNLYGLEVYVCEDLSLDEEIVFNAGTHTDLIKMAYVDFERLVKPKVLNFSVPINDNPGKIVHA